MRLCVLIIISTASRSAHEFHASVTQMQYNAKDRVFEISVRIFTDDFEKALSAASNSKINLDGPPAKHDPLIEKYIQAHFSYVSPQKQTKPVKYVGHEVEADANWLYLEMPYTEPFKGGLLKQNVLMELFDDQVNMVNVQYQGQKKTFVFRKNQPVQDISFD
ncbi:DUF6702 family protein [Spirosoma sp. KCTC 42546]|uniref:DUF6702 family protein n=1 Tax=Spirosoma sp. KCTC 42546 TaxID=2520506 RepID=UPI001FEE7DFA|nr:DUF6702 family protein [Spirosoma sp. KCTC 42546]